MFPNQPSIHTNDSQPSNGLELKMMSDFFLEQPGRVISSSTEASLKKDTITSLTVLASSPSS